MLTNINLDSENKMQIRKTCISCPLGDSVRNPLHAITRESQQAYE